MPARRFPSHVVVHHAVQLLAPLTNASRLCRGRAHCVGKCINVRLRLTAEYNGPKCARTSAYMAKQVRPYDTLPLLHPAAALIASSFATSLTGARAAPALAAPAPVLPAFGLPPRPPRSPAGSMHLSSKQLRQRWMQQCCCVRQLRQLRQHMPRPT